MKRAAFGLLCLFVLVPAAAFAQINSISPNSFFSFELEQNATLTGTDLFGDFYGDPDSDNIFLSTHIVIDGPAGTFAEDISGGFRQPGTLNDTIFIAIPDGTLFVEGRYSVTVIAHDDTGDRSIGPVFYDVVPRTTAQPPLISVPENVVGEADSPTGGHVTFEVSGFSFVDPPPAPTITCNHHSGDFFPLGSTTVNCTATDSFGSAFGSFEVFVQDSQPPVITVPANFSSNTSVVTYSVSAVDAVDGSVPVTCDPASGSAFPNGAITVNCSAEDLRANVSFASFVVTVSDPGQPPALTVPEDIFAEATSPAGAVVTYSVTAGAGATVSCSPPSGSVFAIGVNPVACSATSPGGTTNATFNVTVLDTVAPVLTVPSTIHVEATSASGAVVTYTVSANDAISGPATVTCDPPSGSTFPIGTTTVRCSAQDAHFNIGFGSFDVVVVQDLTPPVIVSVTATPNNLWPPDHKAVAVTITVVAVDAIDPHPTAHIVGVSSNQPINGIGDGNTLTDWTITGPLTLNLLSERTGGSDRVYTITIASTDASGNSSFGTVTVTVSNPRGRAAHH
jgi:hypothetical protein